MKEFTSADDILDFAIDAEQQAVNFYTRLAKNAKTEDMREVFQQFAKEEIRHKTRLTSIKETRLFTLSKEKVADLKIGDYLVTVQVTDDMSYQDALIVAMKREKAAYKLYNNLAAKSPTDDLRKVFLSLAQEEAKHKLRFEVEYDEHILSEN
ncbi:MAG: ferritin family protein [Chlorobi bacterium]|nr:ferritin family protein [Chlorobiota bacterium]